MPHLLVTFFREGTEQFSGGVSPAAAAAAGGSHGQQTVPLSVALEYVGSILDSSRKEINRLKVRYGRWHQKLRTA